MPYTKKRSRTLFFNVRYRPYIVQTMRMENKCFLFRYQQRCVKWIKQRRISQQKYKLLPSSTITKNPSISHFAVAVQQRGVIIRMDVGMGKTPTILTHCKQFGWNVLWICPLNVVTHIKDLIVKHFGSKLRILIVQNALFWDEYYLSQADIVIMSYYTTSHMEDQFAVQGMRHTFQTCVLDEIQEVAGQKEKRFISHCVSARFCVGLTATAKISMAPFLGMVNVNIRLHKDIFYFFQPPCFRHFIEFLEMSPQTKRSYQEITNLVHACQNGNKQQSLLKQARKMISLDKTKFVVTIIKEKIMKHFKVVVVSDHSETLQSINTHFSNQYCALLSTKIQGVENRKKILSRFQDYSSSGCNLLLACPEIISLGIDLGFADVMIVVDPPYTQGKEQQLLGRLRRMCQKPKYVRVQQILQIIMKDSCDFILFKSNQTLEQQQQQQQQQQQPSGISERTLATTFSTKFLQALNAFFPC